MHSLFLAGLPLLPFAANASPVPLFTGIAAVLAVCALVIRANPRWGIVAAAAVGLGANGYLLLHKLFPSGPAICSVNEIVNCDKVNASAASELFGVPVTLFGVAFYAGLIVAAATNAKRLHQVNGLFGLASLAFSAYLANESAKLGLVCPFCIAIYGANILLFWAAFRGMAQDGVSLFEQAGSAITSAASLTVSGVFLLVFGAGLGQVLDKSPPPPISKSANPSAEVAALYMATGGIMHLDGQEPLLGRPDARYEIVEFADFACGHCAHAFPQLHELVEKHPDVSLRYKNYPLSGECNPKLAPGRPEVCLGALAAECAHRQDKFWEYADTMYTNIGRLSEGDLEFMADQVGLDMEKWRACVQDPTVIENVINDSNDGSTLQIGGTPTLFLRGTNGSEWVQILNTPDDVARLIEAARDGVSLPTPGPFVAPE